jgi:hypothetical protein
MIPIYAWNYICPQLLELPYSAPEKNRRYYEMSVVCYYHIGRWWVRALSGSVYISTFYNTYSPDCCRYGYSNMVF